MGKQTTFVDEFYESQSSVHLQWVYHSREYNNMTSSTNKRSTSVTGCWATRFSTIFYKETTCSHMLYLLSVDNNFTFCVGWSPLIRRSDCSYVRSFSGQCARLVMLMRGVLGLAFFRHSRQFLTALLHTTNKLSGKNFRSVDNIPRRRLWSNIPPFLSAFSFSKIVKLMGEAKHKTSVGLTVRLRKETTTSMNRPWCGYTTYIEFYRKQGLFTYRRPRYCLTSSFDLSYYFLRIRCVPSRVNKMWTFGWKMIGW